MSKTITLEVTPKQLTAIIAAVCDAIAYATIEIEHASGPYWEDQRQKYEQLETFLNTKKPVTHA